MKTLYLMRHAKSSWDYPELSDHDRPLNNRGRQDAALMGKQLLSREISPDLILTSTAVRALTTATLVARELDYDLEKIHTESGIYQSDKNQLLQILREMPDEIESLFFVGHNFPISELANLLAVDTLADMPTAAVVALEIPVNSWPDIEKGTNKVIFYDKPKNYKDKEKKDKDKEKEKDKEKKARKEKAKEKDQDEE